MVTVPSQYQQYLNEAASGTKLPIGVVTAQANEESGFNPSAVSPTGAEGFWQFEPGTYDSVASAAGVQPGTEFNVADETKAYIVLMNQLLQQEGGSVFKALEAYNAGPGNLPAGAGYANTILNNAGQPVSISSTGGSGTSSTSTSTTGFPGGVLDPLNWFGSIGGGADNVIKGAVGDVLKAFLQSLGITAGLKDLFQRLGLILLGAVLIIVGILVLTRGTSQGTPINITTNSSTDETTGTSTKSRRVNTPVSKHTSAVKSSTEKKSLAGEAVDAAIVALCRT